jgi:hypothetical protein
MWSERKHGLSTEQVPVSAYVVSSENLTDLQSNTVSFVLGVQLLFSSDD